MGAEAGGAALLARVPGGASDPLHFDGGLVPGLRFAGTTLGSGALLSLAPMRRDLAITLIRDRLPELRRRFAVRRLAVFGSVARDEATDRSDVDVLVDFDGPASFDGYFGLKEELEALLGTRVDLATRAMLKPRIKPRIEGEAVDVS